VGHGLGRTAHGIRLLSVLYRTTNERKLAPRHSLREGLSIGDRVLIPSVGQRCAVYVEGGAPELFCSRPRGAHHQVTFFRDSVQVWKAGNPDNPVWSGKP